MLRGNIIGYKDQKIHSQRPTSTIHHGHVNFSSFPCFWTSSVVEDAVVEAIQSTKFNSCSLDVGILPAMRGQFRKRVEKTPEDFFLRINHILKEGSEICWNRIKKFPCSSVPYKPEGEVKSVIMRRHY
nr:S-alkyl-thiohydroximate lyase SUR1-like isoform X1 [Ziziphus jujuba var. spinosa]